MDTSFSNQSGLAVCGRTFCYQSFTAAQTGLLTRARVTICNTGNPSSAGSLSLFDGDCASSQDCDGSTGFLQESETGTGNCNPFPAWGDYRFSPGVPVVAGRSYTFRINGVTAYERNSGGYGGGATYEDLNSGLVGDVPFEIYLEAQNRVVVSDFVYFGSPSENGTWRMGPVGTDLEFQVRQADSWITVTTMAAP